mgnify:CR=1 FL=1
MDAPNGLKAGNVYAMILAFALMLLAFCYWAGRRSVHCATPDPTTEEVLRATVAAQEAELADAFTVRGTEFKPELARRTLVRQLRDVVRFIAVLEDRALCIRHYEQVQPA